MKKHDIIDDCAAAALDTCHLVMRSMGTEMSKRSPLALSMRQMIALMIIREEQGTSLSFLAERLGGTISAASKLVDGLVDDGYVARNTATEDRRKLMLALTDQGHHALASVQLEEMSYLRNILSSLTPGECQMVILGLGLLRTAVTAGQPEPPDRKKAD